MLRWYGFVYNQIFLLGISVSFSVVSCVALLFNFPTLVVVIFLH